jgi:hypothetical protein
MAAAIWIGGFSIISAFTIAFGRTITTDMAFALWAVCVPATLFAGDIVLSIPRGWPRRIATACILAAMLLFAAAIAYSLVVANLYAGMAF